MRLYLDLETYRPRKEVSFVKERIISSGLLIDETPYQKESLGVDVEPVLVSEWDGFDERKIVKNTQDQVRESLMTHDFTVLCGFNILRFDIPLMLCKCVQHSLGKHNVVAKMWNDCFTIDYFQHLLVANGNRFKGLSLDKITQVAESLSLNPPPYSTPGSSVKDLYDRGEHKEIEKHLKEDLRVVRWLDLYGARRLIQMSIREGKALFLS